VNLVFYSPRFLPLLGGLERVVWLWATALSEAGHEVAVITSTPAEQPDAFPFRVLRRSGLRTQLQYMRRADAVVQVNISLKGLPLLWLSGKPLIISHHTLLTNGRYRWRPQQQLKLWLCNQVARANICCSQYVARQFSHCTVVVHSPYQATAFTNLHLPRTPASVLFVGRLVSDKGADLLVDAFAQVVKQVPLATLTICGAGHERQALERQVAQLGLQASVTFAGAVSSQKLVQLMNTHLVVAIPSRVEPFGTVVAEALACGCRVITSNAGGLPEAGGGFAAVVAMGEVAALAAAMVEQLQRGAEVQPADGLERFLSGLTPEATAGQLLGILIQSRV
jgi:glycosyltransferase involved in cell wall biosynthesis